MQPAPTISSPRTSTAPSCSGEYGLKIVASRSAETRGAHRACRTRGTSSRRTSRSIAMMAPVALRLSRSTASAISSATTGARRRAEQAEDRRLSQPRQRLPQLRLEHDQRGEHAVGEDHAEQVGDHRQLEQERGEVDDRQHQQAEHDLERPRADEEAQQARRSRTRRSGSRAGPASSASETAAARAALRPSQRLRERERVARGGDVVHPEQPRAPLPRERAGGGGRAVARLDRLSGDGAEEPLARRADQDRAARAPGAPRAGRTAGDSAPRVFEKPKPGSTTVALGRDARRRRPAPSASRSSATTSPTTSP